MFLAAVATVGGYIASESVWIAAGSGLVGAIVGLASRAKAQQTVVSGTQLAPDPKVAAPGEKPSAIAMQTAVVVAAPPAAPQPNVAQPSVDVPPPVQPANSIAAAIAAYDSSIADSGLPPSLAFAEISAPNQWGKQQVRIGIPYVNLSGWTTISAEVFDGNRAVMLDSYTGSMPTGVIEWYTARIQGELAPAGSVVYVRVRANRPDRVGPYSAFLPVRLPQ